MASTIRYEFEPELINPILIEGLPGVGNVGKIAADLVADKLNARLFARIFSDDLPPQVLVNEESVVEPVCHELWYAQTPDGQDLVFLLGDFQGTSPAGQYNLSEFVFRTLLPHDPSLILTLGGYGLGQVITEPRVIGVVSDPLMKTQYEPYGVQFIPNEPKGGIVGAAAMLLAFGKIHGIKSLCIIGETSGFVIDAKSARNLIDVMSKMFNVDIDTSELQDSIDQLDAINNNACEIAAGVPKEDLSYIG